MEQYINQIINADCLDIMKNIPNESIDLVCTDCPYHIANQGGAGRCLKKWKTPGQIENYENVRTGKMFANNDIEFEDWLPEIYTKFEFPNANCIGCVKSGSVWYWQLVRKHFPEIFKQRAEQSRKLGCRLVDMGKDHEPRHIFLDELPENAVGRKPKSCYVECGIFCTLGQED